MSFMRMKTWAMARQETPPTVTWRMEAGKSMDETLMRVIDGLANPNPSLEETAGDGWQNASRAGIMKKYIEKMAANPAFDHKRIEQYRIAILLKPGDLEKAYRELSGESGKPWLPAWKQDELASKLAFGIETSTATSAIVRLVDRINALDNTLMEAPYDLLTFLWNSLVSEEHRGEYFNPKNRQPLLEFHEGFLAELHRNSRMELEDKACGLLLYRRLTTRFAQVLMANMIRRPDLAKMVLVEGVCEEGASMVLAERIDFNGDAEELISSGRLPEGAIAVLRYNMMRQRESALGYNGQVSSP